MCVCLCVCVCACVCSYVEGFWGVLVFLLPAGGLLPASSLINSLLFCVTHTYVHTHTQPATLSLRVRGRCEGIAAKVLKMLLSIKSLRRRRHRVPLLLSLSSLWLISRRVFFFYKRGNPHASTCVRKCGFW